MREIKAQILWEKTYRDEEYFDNSHDRNGRETGKWNGVLLIYRFLILKSSNKNRFLIEPDCIEFSGNNEEKMLLDFENKVSNLEGWSKSGENWKCTKLFPEEVNKNLLKFNLEKYVKEIS